MSEEQQKGLIEHGASFFEKLNYGLGAAALVGALIYPPAETILIAFAALQFAEGALWNWIKNRAGKKKQVAQTLAKPAIAPT